MIQFVPRSKPFYFRFYNPSVHAFLTFLSIPDEIFVMFIHIYTLDTRWNSCLFSCKMYFIVSGMKKKLNVSTNITKTSRHKIPQLR
jgi:hypothetical protein